MLSELEEDFSVFLGEAAGYRGHAFNNEFQRADAGTFYKRAALQSLQPLSQR